MAKLTKEEKHALIEDFARKDLLGYAMAIDQSYIPNWHHEEIAEALMGVERGEINRLMIFAPPRHGKSRLSTEMFPTWYLGKHPDKEVITAAYSEGLATDFGRNARELVGEPLYKKIFGVSLRSDEKSKMKWRTSKGGTYTSVGIGGAITGRGANLFVIDDPIKSQEDAESLLARNKQWDWYRSVAYTRLMKGGAIVLTLTRWHTDDLAGRILEHAKYTGEKWNVIRYPAIAEEDEKHRQKGEALWKGEFPIERLKEIKRTTGSYIWSSLYQGNPITLESQTFKQTWFKYRDESEVDAMDTRNLLTIDTAVSQSERADFTGLCDNRVDKENKWNISAWRQRLTPIELVDLIFNLHEKNHYEKIGIEKTMMTQVMKPFLDQEMRKRDVFLPLVELKHGGVNKEARIRQLTARYESNSIYHIRGRCADLEEELITFPKSTNDDVSDATAYQDQIVESNIKQDNMEPVFFGSESYA